MGMKVGFEFERVYDREAGCLFFWGDFNFHIVRVTAGLVSLFF